MSWSKVAALAWRHNLAEIESGDYPDERLAVCRNPLGSSLASSRATVRLLI